jgi:hypothetical protein
VKEPFPARGLFARLKKGIPARVELCVNQLKLHAYSRKPESASLSPAFLLILI